MPIIVIVIGSIIAHASCDKLLLSIIFGAK